MKGTSSSACFGRVASPCQARKRTLQGIVALEGNVEGAGLGDLLAGAAILAREPQQFRDRIAHGAQQSQPLAEAAHACIVRLREPEIVIGEVKLAGASGDRTAKLDGADELRIAQRLQERRSC